MGNGLLVHEWIEKIGGSENVLESMAKIYPDAPIFCLWNNAPKRFAATRVRESILAKTPLRENKALALPTMPFVWRHLKPVDADWAVLSSHAFAHHARVVSNTGEVPKLVYAYTPARYVWSPGIDSRGKGLLARAGSSLLKPLDRRRAQEAVAVAGISNFVAARIQEAWQRDAEVIYPPVDVEAIQDSSVWRPKLTGEESRFLETLPETFILGASRFVPYKDLWSVIRAGEQAGSPVVIVGSGPQEMQLREFASSRSVPVQFAINPSNPFLYALYERASVFVFPPLEDFGIVPVEAMASGTPVVALNEGGAAETIEDRVSGILIDDFNGDLGEAVVRAMALNPDDCRRRARLFSHNSFRQNLTGWVSRSIYSSGPEENRLMGGI